MCVENITFSKLKMVGFSDSVKKTVYIYFLLKNIHASSSYGNSNCFSLKNNR